MNGAYGKGKYCKNPKDEASCLNLGQLGSDLSQSRNPEELKDAWLGWHQVASSYKDSYAKYVEVSNKGAREMGFPDTGALWRSDTICHQKLLLERPNVYGNKSNLCTTPCTNMYV